MQFECEAIVSEGSATSFHGHRYFAKEIQSLMEELSALYPVKVLQEMYELATEEPHSFWYINMVSKSKKDMFYCRLEEKMVLE